MQTSKSLLILVLIGLSALLAFNVEAAPSCAASRPGTTIHTGMVQGVQGNTVTVHSGNSLLQVNVASAAVCDANHQPVAASSLGSGALVRVYATAGSQGTQLAALQVDVLRIVPATQNRAAFSTPHTMAGVRQSQQFNSGSDSISASPRMTDTRDPETYDYPNLRVMIVIEAKGLVNVNKGNGQQYPDGFEIDCQEFHLSFTNSSLPVSKIQPAGAAQGQTLTCGTPFNADSFRLLGYLADRRSIIKAEMMFVNKAKGNELYSSIEIRNPILVAADLLIPPQSGAVNQSQMVAITFSSTDSFFKQDGSK